MIIKERTYKQCGECKRNEMVSEEEYGCDNCKTPINLISGNRKHREFLDITVFKESAGHAHTDMQFCSWKCLLAKLSTIKCDYFISLPYLHYDGEVPSGQTAKAFFKAIKEFSK